MALKTFYSPLEIKSLGSQGKLTPDILNVYKNQNKQSSYLNK